MRGKTGKGAKRVLFFGAGRGLAQMAKNRHGCLFRTPFLWFISFGGAKEMNINQKKEGALLTPSPNICPIRDPINNPALLMLQ